jgi:hypothetical protein
MSPKKPGQPAQINYCSIELLLISPLFLKDATVDVQNSFASASAATSLSPRSEFRSFCHWANY